jgi:hypothetical protein
MADEHRAKAEVRNDVVAEREAEHILKQERLPPERLHSHTARAIVPGVVALLIAILSVVVLWMKH